MENIAIFYEGEKEQVFVGDIYTQDDKHSRWAWGEWEILVIDRFEDGMPFPRVTRRNISTGLVDENGWNNRGKHLIKRRSNEVPE